MPAFIERYVTPVCPWCDEQGAVIVATHVVTVTISQDVTMQVGPPVCVDHARKARNAINSST